MWYIVLTWVLLGLAYITFPVLQETFRLWFLGWVYRGVTVPPKDVTPTEQPTREIEVPAGIIAYAKSWGQSWAEEEILERAKRLYVELNNWELVYQELLKQDGEN